MLLSVVVTTYNRLETLRATLESILSQKLPEGFDFEVITVDNYSTDDAKAVVLPLEEKSLRLKYLHEKIQGKCRALNRGINEAKGDILVFTDDDVITTPGWLGAIAECFVQFGCDAVGGRVLPDFPEGTEQWIKDNAVKLSGSVVIYDHGEETKKLTPDMYRFIGANLAVKKEIFAECGLFRIDLGPGTPVMGEDTEFVDRLIRAGKSLYYCGRALVYHPVDLKRLNLKFVAKWNTELGHFDAQREMNSSTEIYVYCFGVPRYLWRGVVADFFRLVFNAFDKKGFYNAWRSFFRKVGMIQGYRQHAHIKENKVSDAQS